MKKYESTARARKRWIKDNMRILSCIIEKEKADSFKTYCQNKNSSVNAEIKKLIEAKIAGD